MGEIGQRRGSAWGGWNGWGRVGAWERAVQCSAGALAGVFDSEPRVGMELSVVWIWVRRSVRLFRSVVGGRRSVVQTAGRWSVGRWVHRVKLVMERGSREQDGRGPLLVATAQLTAAKAKGSAREQEDQRHYACAQSGWNSEHQEGKQASGWSLQPGNQESARLAGDDGQSGDDGFRLRPVWGILQLKWPSPGPHRRSRRRKRA